MFRTTLVVKVKHISVPKALVYKSYNYRYNYAKGTSYTVPSHDCRAFGSIMIKLCIVGPRPSVTAYPTLYKNAMKVRGDNEANTPEL
jgi:hypothetical protein